MAWLWLIIRLYAGWEWLNAGFGKITSPVWTGPGAGTALTGFVNGALNKTAGANPDVNSIYAGFLQTFVLPHAAVWSWATALREVVLAWRVAGWWGLERWFLPLLGTPWWPGRLLHQSPWVEHSGQEIRHSHYRGLARRSEIWALLDRFQRPPRHARVAAASEHNLPLLPVDRTDQIAALAMPVWVAVAAIREGRRRNPHW